MSYIHWCAFWFEGVEPCQGETPITALKSAG